MFVGVGIQSVLVCFLFLPVIRIYSIKQINILKFFCSKMSAQSNFINMIEILYIFKVSLLYSITE